MSSKERLADSCALAAVHGQRNARRGAPVPDGVPRRLPGADDDAHLALKSHRCAPGK